MSRFNLADYQPVEERNAQFWERYPAGRILTDLVFDDGTRYVVRAEVYTDREDTRPAATGYAEEVVSSTGVNKTSALENCETSAEGRALARMGFAPKGARPSREEMEKASRREDPVAAARAALAATAKDNGWDLSRVAAVYAAKAGHPLAEATDAERIGKFREYLFSLPQVDLMPAVNGAPA